MYRERERKNLDNLRFEEWTPTNLDRFHCVPHVCRKDMANLGGIACRRNNDLLDSRAVLIRHLRCRTLRYLRGCYWKRRFANLFFPTAGMASQLVGQLAHTATRARQWGDKVSGEAI